MMARRANAVAALPRRLASNPYCELLYDHVEKLGVDVVDGRSGVRWLLRARRRVDVLHLHWPERHFRQGSLASAVGFALRLGLARLLRYRIVWTVHNAMPHEGASAGDRFVRRVLVRVAHLVVHCDAARATLGRAGRDAVVIPHGSYVGRYPNGITPTAARARLGLEPEARVLLAFGQVRAYKNLDALTRAFAAVDAPGARLVIAGEPVCGTHLAPVADARIRLFLRHVADAEVQVFLNAADLVVLPYRAVLTSGAAMLALSFGRGVVAPRLGCLAELERSGAVCLYDPDRADGLEDALRRALALDAAALGQKARRFVRGLSWNAIARRHLTAYGFAPALAVIGAGRRLSAGRHAGTTRGMSRRAKDGLWT
jgi:beta-1,4-mannosyltransferase